MLAIVRNGYVYVVVNSLTNELNLKHLVFSHLHTNYTDYFINN